MSVVVKLVILINRLNDDMCVEYK